VNGYVFQTGEPITVWRNPNTSSGGSSSTTIVFNPSYNYRLMPKHVSGKSVDVAYASTNYGTPVQQWGTNSNTAQKFKILASGSNWKLAMTINTNKCIGLTNYGTANGTTTEIQDCNGSTHQTWIATLVTGTTDTFTFKNQAANRCLDVAGWSGADGARMQIYDCYGQNNQKFAVAVN
jgi:hypothetical protein